MRELLLVALLFVLHQFGFVSQQIVSTTLFDLDTIIHRGFGILSAMIVSESAIHKLSSSSFDVSVDKRTGAVLSISNSDDHVHMNWISAPENAPWQPLGSRWGLGFADLGANYLHRAYWNDPKTSREPDGTYTATYNTGDLRLVVARSVDEKTKQFTEQYTFKNTGDNDLSLVSNGKTSLAIFTPFNDHYTNTSDVLEHRSHAHVWAGGGTSSWVKMTRMGGRGPHLGLVVTQGGLSGYSVESRDTITSSNTRGVFLLHPNVPSLRPGESTTLAWTMFWHDDWDDFFAQCVLRSQQFVRVDVSSLTVFPNEALHINVSGESVGSDTTIGGIRVTKKHNDSVYGVSIPSLELGEHTLEVSTFQSGKESDAIIIINSVPTYDATIERRVQFIATQQQVDPTLNSPLAGAYVLYDNQIDSHVTFDGWSDRNSGRERLGMGVLIGRWLKHHPDNALQNSLKAYYTFVCSQLQNNAGFVYDGPGDESVRLYNWAWVMQLHLAVNDLNITLAESLSHRTPLQRFITTVENFYEHNGKYFYPIGIPVFDGLRVLRASGNTTALKRVLELFIEHGEQMMSLGIQYPASEVNFEQSIIAPVTIFLLELYRFTGNTTWLDAARPHFTLLELFSGRQPDYHLFDVAIRHWDGYWFGKDRMWGDTFPHYWSTLTAVAMHHYSKATGDASYEVRADGILRSNLALFSYDGKASCAFLYPLSVNGRAGHYADPYANDQDWALVHVLQIREE